MKSVEGEKTLKQDRREPRPTAAEVSFSHTHSLFDINFRF